MIFFEADAEVQVEPQRSFGRLLAAYGSVFLALIGFTLIMVVLAGALVGSLVSHVPGVAWIAALLASPLVQA